MEILRTPDSCFEGLVGYNFKPHYTFVPCLDGSERKLRIHYIDEGPRSGAPILLLHGEPTWIYLYRKMIPPLAAAGYRVVAIDLIGFGRSDKPTKQSDYTYQRHVDWVTKAVENIGISSITFFGQDWGGLIGLRMVTNNVHLFSHVVIGNTFLNNGERKPSDAFLNWQTYVRETKVLPVGGIVGRGVVTPLTPDIVKGYDAPYPDETYKAGAKVFPLLVPTSSSDPAILPNKAAWEVLRKWEKPFLCLFSDSDPVFNGADKPFLEFVPGTKGQPHTTIMAAGHFLQEDKGEEIAQHIIAWLRQDKKDKPRSKL